MAAYNIYEAKTNFSSLVEKAVNGEEIIIAKAGKPVARMVPVAPQESKSVYRKAGRNFAGWTHIPNSLDDPLPKDIQHAIGMLD